MHAGITPFIISLIYKSKWYKMFDSETRQHPFTINPQCPAG